MPVYEYKCLRCEEKHLRAFAEEDLGETYLMDCPLCGAKSRRLPHVEGEARPRPGRPRRPPPAPRAPGL